MDEDEFKEEYGNKLGSMISECLWGENGNQAIIIFSNERNSLIHVYSVNASMADAEKMVMSAASYYIDNDKNERVFH